MATDAISIAERRQSIRWSSLEVRNAKNSILPTLTLSAGSLPDPRVSHGQQNPRRLSQKEALTGVQHNDVLRLRTVT